MEHEHTNQEALWDFDHNAVREYRINGAAAQGSGILPGDPEANAAWLPVVRVLPADFAPGQPRLLGRSVYELHPDGDMVVETFPEADFSPDAFRANARRIAHERAHDALSRTDWYVVRAAETGVPVPAKVAGIRASIREAITAEDARVEAMTPAELQDYAAVEINNVARELDDFVRAAWGEPS